MRFVWVTSTSEDASWLSPSSYACWLPLDLTGRCSYLTPPALLAIGLRSTQPSHVIVGVLASHLAAVHVEVGF